MKISILLIEDDRDMRDLVARHLEHSGFDVQKAEDGIRGQALALQYSLASIFATSIARDGSLTQTMATLADAAMRKARSVDSQQQTSRKLITGRFVQNRR